MHKYLKSHINEDNKSTIKKLRDLAKEYNYDLSGFCFCILNKDLLQAKQWYHKRFEDLTDRANAGDKAKEKTK